MVNGFKGLLSLCVAQSLTVRLVSLAAFIATVPVISWRKSTSSRFSSKDASLSSTVKTGTFLSFHIYLPKLPGNVPKRTHGRFLNFGTVTLGPSKSSTPYGVWIETIKSGLKSSMCAIAHFVSGSLPAIDPG